MALKISEMFMQFHGLIHESTLDDCKLRGKWQSTSYV